MQRYCYSAVIPTMFEIQAVVNKSGLPIPDNSFSDNGNGIVNEFYFQSDLFSQGERTLACSIEFEEFIHNFEISHHVVTLNDVEFVVIEREVEFRRLEYRRRPRIVFDVRGNLKTTQELPISLHDVLTRDENGEWTPTSVRKRIDGCIDCVKYWLHVPEPYYEKRVYHPVYLEAIAIVRKAREKTLSHFRQETFAVDIALDRLQCELAGTSPETFVEDVLRKHLSPEMRRSHLPEAIEIISSADVP